jgi:hypothetical protein
MGFMDKAKKMAEQAQEKLDEVQGQFNQGQQGGQQQPQQAVRYDEHGRPIEEAPPAGQAPPPPAEPSPPEPSAQSPEPNAAPPAGGDANANPDPFKPIE